MRWNVLTRPLFVIAVAFFVLGSCDSRVGSENQEQEKTSPAPGETTEEDEVQMRKVSELAALMRTMHAELKAARPQLQQGASLPGDFWSDYGTMITAQSTPGMVKNRDKFESFAESYLYQVEILKTDPTVKHFNAVVSSCVSCHQQYCMGPIDKIEKLTINN